MSPGGCQFGQSADVTIGIDKITSLLSGRWVTGKHSLSPNTVYRLCVGGKRNRENTKIFQLRRLNRR